MVSCPTMLKPTIACPKATQDIGTNLQNRQNAIKVAHYGPANPRLPNEKFWSEIAGIWDVPVSEAKSMRCGNCAAFDITPEMLDCISRGLSEEGSDPLDTLLAAELGYCHAFRFKCAASRTCSAWIVGGPIREHRERGEVVSPERLTRRARR